MEFWDLGQLILSDPPGMLFTIFFHLDICVQKKNYARKHAQGGHVCSEER